MFNQLHVISQSKAPTNDNIMKTAFRHTITQAEKRQWPLINASVRCCQGDVDALLKEFKFISDSDK